MHLSDFFNNTHCILPVHAFTGNWTHDPGVAITLFSSVWGTRKLKVHFENQSMWRWEPNRSRMSAGLRANNSSWIRKTEIKAGSPAGFVKRLMWLSSIIHQPHLDNYSLAKKLCHKPPIQKQAIDSEPRLNRLLRFPRAKPASDSCC